MAKKTSKKLSEILASKVRELTTGIVSEELTAVYWDSSTLKHQPEPLYRLDMDNYRYYYKLVNGVPDSIHL